MEITQQQRRPPYFTADRFRMGPGNSGADRRLTSDDFLRQQSSWCRRMAGDDLLDAPVRETLLDLAREYEERLAVIEQTVSVSESACADKLAAD
jgi:hypothetical protein